MLKYKYFRLAFLTINFSFFVSLLFYNDSSHANSLSSLEQEIKTITNNTNNNPDFNVKGSSIRSKFANYQSLLRACQESNLNTNTVCIQGNNKTWNQASSMIGSIADVGSMAMSASCSKFANALKMVQAAQTGVRGTCAFQKSDCIDKCSKAEKIAKLLKKDLDDLAFSTTQFKSSLTNSAPSAQTNQKTPAPSSNKQSPCSEEAKLRGFSCTQDADNSITNLQGKEEENNDNYTNNKIEELNKLAYSTQKAIESLESIDSDEDSPTAIKRVCTATANEATSKMAMNLSTLMMSMQKNSACAQDFATFDTGLDLSDCNITGTCTTSIPDECLDPKNKDAIYCKIPSITTDTRSTGGGASSTTPTNPDFALDTKSLSDLNMDGLGGVGDDGSGGMPNLGDTPGPKSAGVPGGGGGGGLSIPGGGSNPPRGGGGRGVSNDTNYGASPSYAGNGGNFGGSSDKKNEDLQQYLPGGAKDPTLSKAAGPEGITPSAGPTIFEKVSKGYKNSRSTLIPE